MPLTNVAGVADASATTGSPAPVGVERGRSHAGTPATAKIFSPTTPAIVAREPAVRALPAGCATIARIISGAPSRTWRSPLEDDVPVRVVARREREDPAMIAVAPRSAAVRVAPERVSAGTAVKGVSIVRSSQVQECLSRLGSQTAARLEPLVEIRRIAGAIAPGVADHALLVDQEGRPFGDVLQPTECERDPEAVHCVAVPVRKEPEAEVECLCPGDVRPRRVTKMPIGCTPT